MHLLNIDEMNCGLDIDKPEQSATGVLKNIEIFLPLKGLIDIDKELDRLNNKIKDIKARMDNVKRKLDNDSFIKNAPDKIVKHETEKYNSYLNDYNKLMENYNSISSSK
jgi:valyl-tRNA synthetase